MPRNVNGKSPDLCKEKNCLEPRYKPGKTTHSYCEIHQKALWKKYSSRYDDNDETETRTEFVSEKAIEESHQESLPALAPICSLCRRSPHQAAHFALYVNTWCVACTPMSVSRDDLLRRVLPDFSAPVPAPAPEAVQPANNSAEIDNLRAQLAAAQREIRVLQQAINSPAQPEGDFKILVMDFEESCVRYLTGCQQRSESFPTTREEMTSFQLNAARDGYILARRHTNKALETL